MGIVEIVQKQQKLHPFVQQKKTISLSFLFIVYFKFVFQCFILPQK